MTRENLYQLTGKIVDACYEVHSNLGAGLLESVYETCLCKELEIRNVKFARQPLLKIKYKSHVIDQEFRIDLLVENEVIVELKAVEKIIPVHKAQMITYLRLSGKKVGLLINFNTPLIKDGIRRIVYGL